MASGTELTPNEYINHHLSFFGKQVGDGSFWTLNMDSISVSILLGVVGFGLFWWIARGATAGVPGKRQAFIELVFDFIDNQTKGVFKHERHAFVAPAALTVFIWVLLMNSMDFLPVDWIALGTHSISEHGFRIVPTSDVNTTFALSLTVLALTVFFAIKVKGFGGWIHELFCSPFGSNPLVWAFNLLFNLIEYISKPLSHSLRLFGNMYAGEMIFLLLWMWAANSAWSNDYYIGLFVSMGLAWAWAVFHILIVALQAYVFMMLTIVYISMAHQHH